MGKKKPNSNKPRDVKIDDNMKVSSDLEALKKSAQGKDGAKTDAERIQTALSSEVGRLITSKPESAPAIITRQLQLMLAAIADNESEYVATITKLHSMLGTNTTIEEFAKHIIMMNRSAETLFDKTMEPVKIGRKPDYIIPTGIVVGDRPSKSYQFYALNLTNARAYITNIVFPIYVDAAAQRGGSGTGNGIWAGSTTLLQDAATPRNTEVDYSGVTNTSLMYNLTTRIEKYLSNISGFPYAAVGNAVTGYIFRIKMMILGYINVLIAKEADATTKTSLETWLGQKLEIVESEIADSLALHPIPIQVIQFCASLGLGIYCTGVAPDVSPSTYVHDFATIFIAYNMALESAGGGTNAYHSPLRMIGGTTTSGARHLSPEQENAVLKVLTYMEDMTRGEVPTGKREIFAKYSGLESTNMKLRLRKDVLKALQQFGWMCVNPNSLPQFIDSMNIMGPDLVNQYKMATATAALTYDDIEADEHYMLEAFKYCSNNCQIIATTKKFGYAAFSRRAEAQIVLPDIIHNSADFSYKHVDIPGYACSGYTLITTSTLQPTTNSISLAVDSTMQKLFLRYKIENSVTDLAHLKEAQHFGNIFGLCKHPQHEMTDADVTTMMWDKICQMLAPLENITYVFDSNTVQASRWT